MLKSYKTEIFPTPEQKQIIHRTVYADLSIIFILHIIKKSVKKKKNLFRDMTFQNG